MFHKTKINALLFLCCIFQGVYGNYTREQLENYFERPVFSYTHMIDFHVVDQWLYTTELSKTLLVGGSTFFHVMRDVPGIGILSSAVEPIFDNRFSDTRFESFIENVGKFSQQELQEAIQDAILLSSASTRSYTTPELLNYVIAALEDKIDLIENQIRHDFKYDQKLLLSIKKSCAVLVGLIAIVATTSKICSCDHIKKNTAVALGRVKTFAGLCLLPASYKVLSSYNVLTKSPNAYNRHLNEFKELLTFVLNLQKDLKETGTIRFTLANQRIATVKVQDTLWGSTEGIVLDLDT